MAVLSTRAIIEQRPREDIGRTLSGSILEIGPGHDPFPTSPGARVTYADRSVEGGRDTTWPELAGQPHGPDADIDLDLDRSGLGAIPDHQFDAVVACHVIEHLANPIEALREMERVLRPGGRLVLVIPDRTRTFDCVRQPTPLSHLLDDFERGVTEVDTEHIREFCEAIYGQPPIHPHAVREWYDPSRLDEALFDLHRRRSIHAHCWTPEEFVVVLAALLARGLASWDLVDLYFHEDEGAVDNEFGFVLERPLEAAAPTAQAEAFARRWASLLLGARARDPRRLIALHAALLTNLHCHQELAPATNVISEILGVELVGTRQRAAQCQEALASATAESTDLAHRLQASEQQMTEMLRSRTYRASRVLSAWLRPVRRLRSMLPP